MPDRPAAKAGSWYPAGAEALRAEVDRCLDAAEPGLGGPAVGGLVPHAGLSFSGPIAGRVFRFLQEGQTAVRTVLVFGAVHTKHLRQPAIWAEGVWETPLGDLPVDEELARALIDAGAGTDDPSPHYGDNAIELQTPFIRHIWPGARILPLATPPAPDAVEAGRAVWEVLRERGRDGDTLILGSTDLTHYGAAFGLMPAGAGPSAVEWTKANDEKLLARVRDMDAEGVLQRAGEDHSACGAGAIAAATACARAAGVDAARVLEHTTSYDIMPDGRGDHIVGYAAVVFPAPRAP
jgi:hypothetical protein